MGAHKTKIAYADYAGGDANFVERGVWRGDCEVSPGCDNCWARAVGERFGHMPGRGTWHPDRLDRLMSWHPRKRDDWKGDGGERPLVLVCSTGDLFHSGVPAEFIIKAFEMMVARDDIIWLVLTKRPERIRSILLKGGWASWLSGHKSVFENIWMGVSAEDQIRWDERVAILCKSWTGTKWVSIEPMLEPIAIDRLRVDWIVVGGESGPNRRPFDVRWAEDIYQQCRFMGIPFFGKQIGGQYPGFRLLVEGREVKEWPK